ncbi:mycofactocin-coupled SDR family oxidoreductase [Rhodococcus sp. DMU1]|uniref:mycofactocin-coupled SDR family oxidoreductase n=1 Tax=Rhodococcus sp. DMU1 TaxID=2722825 RepID=UPI00143E8237|nr:mycofactocin-coupled SDR family oxidoreductase [Rhodococcus sp. DMU1]QIX53864.1 mycofactocin-coupled SDR family oxidoreductase [Rhodococcus sp. DMU1]
MGKLDNKVALVSGAARGQGRNHALRLAEEGADIVAVDLCQDIATVHYPLSRPEDLDETVRLIEKLDRRVVARQADVRDPVALSSAVNDGIAEFGRLDIVVANAGIAPLGADVPPIGFMDAVNVNFIGVANTVTAALQHLGKGSSIICTGSLAAFLTRDAGPDANGPGGAGYTSSKKYLAQFVHDLALQLAPHNIRVNAVHPTNCDTDMLQSAPMYKSFRPDLAEPTREDALETFPMMNALGGVPWVEVDDVSNAVLFLACDDSRFVTGLQLRVDAGGYLKVRDYTP